MQVERCFRGAEQNEPNKILFIELEWLFLTIAPCDAAEPLSDSS